MNVYIPTKEELDETVYKAVKQVMREEMPEVIHKANRKQWLTTDDAMEFLQCSRRHLQYLRDTQQLTYTKNGRTIHYNVDDIEEFLNKGKLKVDEIKKAH